MSHLETFNVSVASRSGLMTLVIYGIFAKQEPELLMLFILH
jgi:hypothetical protein